MRLREYLAPERTLVPLRARTLQEAASRLLERLASAREVLDLDRLSERVVQAGDDDVVAMGDRAFLLHHRTSAVGRLLVAVGVAASPIVRTGADGAQSASIVLLVVTPPRLAARYLQVVGAFARLLRKPEHFSAILAARGAEELVSLPAFEDAVLPDQLTVRDVMSHGPTTIAPDESLRGAARTLARTGLGALPVVDDDLRVIGMLSEREVIRYLLSTQAFAGPDTAAAAPGAARKMCGMP